MPLRSLGYWTQRFVKKVFPTQALEKRFGEQVLPFTDPETWRSRWSAQRGAGDEPGWSNGDIPAEHAIRGFQGVTLLLESAAKIAAIVIDVFGFREIAGEVSVIRYAAPDDANGSVVGFLRGHQGRDSVHHIAFRAADDAR